MNQIEILFEMPVSYFVWVSFFGITVVGFLLIVAFGVFVFQWGAHVKTIEQFSKACVCQKQIDELAEMNWKLGIAIKHIQQQQQGGFTVSPRVIVDAAEANDEIQQGIAQLARGFSGTAGVGLMIHQQRPLRQIRRIARPGL